MNNFSEIVQGLMNNKNIGDYGRHEILWFMMYHVKFEMN